MMPFCCVAIDGMSWDVFHTIYRDGSCHPMGDRGKHANLSQPSQQFRQCERHFADICKVEVRAPLGFLKRARHAQLSAPPAGIAREPAAHRATTNGFAIRSSSEFSCSDKYLAVPSNGFLTAADIATGNATALTMAEIR